MKFKIRFADQIVGFFIILSLVSLVFVIVMLGRSQRWFSKDVSYTTILPSAGGLNENMSVQYRGFTIGSVKSFFLNDKDDVEVIFVIHEKYKDRAMLGSMVEVMVSPIGLGNQFLFHPGRGDPLAEGSFIPAVGTPYARELIRQKLAAEPYHDDSISLLMNRASSLLDELNEALGQGSDETEIGQIIRSVRKILAGAETLPGTVDQAVETALKTIEGLQAELTPILANINALTAELNDPDGLLHTALNTDEDIYQGLVKSLRSVSGILDNLDRTTAFIPGQLPQIAGLIVDLRVTIKTAEDVLVALTNNPLLRKGVPSRPETQGSGTGPRDIRF